MNKVEEFITKKTAEGANPEFIDSFKKLHNPIPILNQIDDVQEEERWKNIATDIRQCLKDGTDFKFPNIVGGWTSKDQRKFDKLYKDIKSEFKKPVATNPGVIFLRRSQAEQFCKLQPVYFDSAEIWWIWDADEFKWQMGDETDILNLVFKTINVDCVENKIRNEILNALRQVARLHKPETPEKDWIQFEDKIVDIKNVKIIDASPNYFVTNPIPWKLGTETDTPEMDKLFREWVVGEDQDESYINLLYEIIAYCACSEQFLQNIIALTGSGSNGKGTFLKLLTKFIGIENTCSSNLKAICNGSFETSALYKKLFCNIGEVDYDDLQNTSVIKQLTGEDLIRYEFKGRTPFSDYSPTTLIIATNSLPKTPDTSIGFYRRWVIVDFPHQFKVSADVLARIPQKEYENLALKIVLILKKLYTQSSFSNPQSFDEKAQRYEERSNPIQKFIELHCEEIAGQNTVLRDFTIELNEYLKKKHLRIMTVRSVSKFLKDDGWDIAKRYVTIDHNEYSSVVILNVVLKHVKFKLPKLL